MDCGVSMLQLSLGSLGQTTFRCSQFERSEQIVFQCPEKSSLSAIMAYSDNSKYICTMTLDDSFYEYSENKIGFCKVNKDLREAFGTSCIGKQLCEIQNDISKFDSDCLADSSDQIIMVYKCLADPIKVK